MSHTMSETPATLFFIVVAVSAPSEDLMEDSEGGGLGEAISSVSVVEILVGDLTPWRTGTHGHRPKILFDRRHIQDLAEGRFICKHWR